MKNAVVTVVEGQHHVISYHLISANITLYILLAHGGGIFIYINERKVLFTNLLVIKKPYINTC